MPNEKRTIGSLSRTAWISLLCAALLLVAGVGSVFAYVIIDGSKEPAKQSVVEFVPGKVDVEVTCTPSEEDGVYTFTVTNTGNTAAYVRLAVLCHWRDANGAIYWEEPNMVFTDSLHGDYDLSGQKVDDEDPQWIQGVDDYHYFQMPVEAGEKVPNVFIVRDPTMHPKVAGEAAMADVAPEGYSFSVTVIAEGIQAVGNNEEKPAIQDAWGTTVVTNIGNDGELTIKRKSS